MVVADIYILKVFEEDVKGEEDGWLRKFTVGINGLEFTLDAQIKYLA